MLKAVLLIAFVLKAVQRRVTQAWTALRVRWGERFTVATHRTRAAHGRTAAPARPCTRKRTARMMALLIHVTRHSRCPQVARSFRCRPGCASQACSCRAAHRVSATCNTHVVEPVAVEAQRSRRVLPACRWQAQGASLPDTQHPAGPIECCQPARRTYTSATCRYDWVHVTRLQTRAHCISTHGSAGAPPVTQLASVRHPWLSRPCGFSVRWSLAVQMSTIGQHCVVLLTAHFQNEVPA